MHTTARVRFFVSLSASVQVCACGRAGVCAGVRASELESL